MSATATKPTPSRTPLFERILCLRDHTAAGVEAVRLATALAGPSATIDLFTDGVPEHAPDHDLLVVPASERGLQLLSSSPASVLLARTPSSPAEFPDSILAAVDGTAAASAAARVAAEIAARHSAPVTLVATPEHDASHQHALQRDIEIVERITGTRPLVLDEHRGPVASILCAAAGVEASLIVLGRRASASSPSVSAQVAGAAGCSVLVVRAGGALSPRP